METQVTSIEISPVVQKRAYDKRFYVESTLKAKNGHSCTYQISSQKKKDLPAAIERAKTSVAGGGMFFTDTGMVISKWEMGKKGLQPAAN